VIQFMRDETLTISRSQIQYQRPIVSSSGFIFS
jgi:hypothetical protein